MSLGRLHITAFLLMAALIWFIVLCFQGTSITWAHAKPFSIVVSSLVAIGVLFEFLLWRLPLLHGWFIKRPDLRGTWRVELESSYNRPGTNEPIPIILCYMGIKQTLSRLQMHLMTPDSESRSIANHIRPSLNGSGYQVIGVYTNEPNIHLRGKRISEIHQGTIIIDTHGPDHRPTTMTAKYWTDRKTTGTMHFTARLKTLHTRFADAHSVTWNSAKAKSASCSPIID